jgi:transcriptional regulator with XRE-family HTH domain
MADESLAKKRKASLRKKYNPKPFIDRIEQLMEGRNLSMRETALNSGLDHQAIRRIKAGQRRPDMTYCILLANFFEINPNELLQLGGWSTLKIFDIKRVSADNLPPEAVSVALDIAKIPDPGTRRQVAEAVRTLLKKYFDS